MLQRQDLNSWLQSFIRAGGLVLPCRQTRIIAGDLSRGLSSFLFLPLVCPTPAEKWTSGAGSAPGPLIRPLPAHGRLTLDTVMRTGKASAWGFSTERGVSFCFCFSPS